MRPAMREGIVDQRLARLQGRGSERERTENHRHHPVQPPFRSSTIPPFFQTNPRWPLLSLPFSHFLSFCLSPTSYNPCFSCSLSVSLSRSLLPVLSVSRHSYLAILETQVPVPTCLSSLYARIRVPFRTLATRPCVAYVQAGMCISSICIPT